MNLEGRIGEFKPLHFVIAMVLCLLFGILIFRRLTFEVDARTAQEVAQKTQLQTLTEDVAELKKQLEEEKGRGCTQQLPASDQPKTSPKRAGNGTQK